MSNWYELDTAANLFPSVTTNSNSSVFRISAVMSEEVDRDLLQKATDTIFERFPMLFVRMKKGVFWNYFDIHNKKFTVEEEKQYPCANINPLENNGYLIKVLYFGHRITVEVFHALTDGGGASEFLKSLLYYYLSFKYGELNHENKILLCDDDIKENSVDSFRDYFSDKIDKIKGEKVKQKNSYRIKGTQFNSYGHSIITGVLSAQVLNVIAKSQEATITAYLTACLIYSIFQAEKRYIRNKKPIVIAIPVNLRPLFPSKTLRNFFSVVNLSCVVNKDTAFEEIVCDVSKQLKELTQKDNLIKIATHNVSLSRSGYARAVPLMLKNIFVLLGFDLMGESKKTMTISNLGSIKIPADMEKYIMHLEAAIYPTKKSPINCCVISVNDKLTVSFSKTVKDNDIIKYFFKYLAVDKNIEIGVYSNKWEEKNE